MAIASLSPCPADASSDTTTHKEIHQHTNSNVEEESFQNFLTVSPYDERPHQLDLRTVDISCQLLAKALVHMRSLREDYATAPYCDTFNFNELAESLRTLAANAKFEWKQKDFYIVVFRSQIPPTTIYADLGVLDQAAHKEATQSGGFLKYWFGSPDKTGRNLATCVWRNQNDARHGSVGPAHKKATAATRFLYSEWGIERLRLRVTDDAEEWKISEWS